MKKKIHMRYLTSEISNHLSQELLMDNNEWLDNKRFLVQNLLQPSLKKNNDHLYDGKVLYTQRDGNIPVPTSV